MTRLDKIVITILCFLSVCLILIFIFASGDGRADELEKRLIVVETTLGMMQLYS